MLSSPDTDIDVSLSEALDFTPGCEHKRHDLDRAFHKGDAAWLESLVCNDCGLESTGLICDQWRKTVLEWTKIGIRFYCPACKKSQPGESIRFLPL